MIKINELSLVYKDGTKALENINLSIDKNEFVVITGVSGSGKTSLLKVISGEEKPTNGEIFVFSKPVDKTTREKIGQTLDLIESQSVFENIYLPLRFSQIKVNLTDGKSYSNLSHKEKTELVETIAHRVGVFHLLNKSVDEISKGEAQRVSIARAAILKPPILLADEPTANLDRDNAVNVFRLLSSLVAPDTTVVLNTHSSEFIKGRFRHIQLENGKIVKDELVQNE